MLNAGKPLLLRQSSATSIRKVRHSACPFGQSPPVLFLRVQPLESRNFRASVDMYCREGCMKSSVGLGRSMPNVSRQRGKPRRSAPPAQWGRSVPTEHAFRDSAATSFVVRARHIVPIEGRLITNHQSLITAFLIDTPAIRIAPKSFNCITSTHSNRHSSGAWRLHKSCASRTTLHGMGE